jgi:hypothetical protein
MDILASAKRQHLAKPVALAVFGLASMGAIGGWSMGDEDWAVPRDEPVTLASDAGTTVAPFEFPAAAKAPGAARSRLRCAECGVIEALQTVQAREEVMAVCTVGYGRAIRIPGSVTDTDLRLDVPPLADALASAMPGDHRATRVRVTTRHQVVVRLRDGSRHVIDDEAPRTLRVGERVQFIAGATAWNG